MKYCIGDRIIITGDGEFPDGTTGKIQVPPEEVISLVPNGEWIGAERNFVTPTGKHRSYWVEFDQPTDDGSGDGPYKGSEISANNLEILKYGTDVLSSTHFRDDDSIEKEIVRKKQRKISKHFSIILNGIKTKIVNYRFKSENYDFSDGKTIELISKMKIPYSNDELNHIVIEHKGKTIKITGKWIHGFFSKGNYAATFLIITEEIEMRA